MRFVIYVISCLLILIFEKAVFQLLANLTSQYVFFVSSKNNRIRRNTRIMTSNRGRTFGKRLGSPYKGISFRETEMHIEIKVSLFSIVSLFTEYDIFFSLYFFHDHSLPLLNTEFAYNMSIG